MSEADILLERGSIACLERELCGSSLLISECPMIAVVDVGELSGEESGGLFDGVCGDSIMDFKVLS